MIRQPFLALVAGVTCLAAWPLAYAAGPLTTATVTKLENSVKYGESQGTHSATRPAKVSDVLRSQNFLLTDTDSRAELQYEDGSVVRVGQNTVFSFEERSRTLTLEKGSLIFYIPKGAGGGQIKTPSLTGAITGTVGKVSTNTIAILDGEITLKPSGQVVHAGEFARRNPDGTISIAPFDPSTVWDGKLMNFHGPMPGFNESRLKLTGLPTPFPAPDVSAFETENRIHNQPSAIKHFFPEPEKRRKKNEEEPSTPLPTPRPTPRPTPKPTPFPDKNPNPGR